MANEKPQEVKLENSKEQVVEVKEKAQEQKKVKVSAQKIEDVILPDGRKFRIFEKEVTELPEKNISYVTKEGFDKMMADEKAEKAKLLAMPAPPAPPVGNILTDEIPVLETVEVKSNDVTIVSQKAIEADPEVMIKEEAVAGAQTPVVIEVKKEEPKQEIVAVKAEEKKEETLVVNTSEEYKTPVSLEVRSEIERIFDVGVSQGQSLVDEKTKKAVEEEKRLLSQEIERREQVQRDIDFKNAQDKALTEMEAKEAFIRKNKALSEGNENPTAPATADELKTVKILDKKEQPAISLPQPKKQEEQKTVVLVNSQVINARAELSNKMDMELLEEGDGIEEATGPDYGSL